MITKLTTKNLKGRSLTLELTDANQIVGANATGKTSIIDAIKLGMLGEHDKLGRQGKKLACLMSGDHAEVTIDYEDGTSSKWGIKASGTTAKIECEGQTNDPSIRMALCPEEFWGMGSTAQTETLFRMCGDSTLVTKDYIGTSIARVRRTGMTEADHVDLEELAQVAKEMIVDNDISSLGRLKEAMLECRTERNAELRLLNAQIESSIDVELDATHTEKDLNDILEESKCLTSRLDKAIRRRDIKDRLQTKSDCLVEIDEILDNKNKLKELQLVLDEKNKDLKYIDERILSHNDDDTLGTLKDDTQPTRGKNYEIQCSAQWTGDAFVPDADSVVYIDHEAALEQREAQHKLEQDKRELESEIEDTQFALSRVPTEEEHKLTDAESTALEIMNRVDFDEMILGIDAELRQVQTKAHKIKDDIESLAYHNHLEKVRKKLTESRDEILGKCGNIKFVISTLREIEGNIVDTAMDDAMSVVNAVCAGIIPSAIEWYNGTLGRWAGDDGWIPIESFSGAEQAVAQMAMTTALSSRSKFRICVLDEVTRVDKANAEKLLANLDTLLADGVIDQYILFSTEVIRHPVTDEGCKTHTLTH
jgi:hypothetical protein